MIDITPNGTGLPGIEQLRIIVEAVMTVGLVLSVLALIISAIVWDLEPTRQTRTSPRGASSACSRRAELRSSAAPQSRSSISSGTSAKPSEMQLPRERGAK